MVIFMDLQQMRYFLAVAETGNITAAAKILHMAQPPLSRQIKQIETELNTVLFDRNGRRLHLTEAGMLLVSRVQEILNLTERSLQEVHNFSAGAAGTLALGAVDSAASFLLPDFIADFHQQYPKTKFELCVTETLRIVELLEKGVIEVGIIRHPFDIDYFANFSLPAEKLVVIAPESYHLNDAAPLAISELAQYPLLIHRKYAALLTKIFQKHNCTPNFFCQNDSIVPLISWAKAGLGAAIIPESAASLAQSAHLKLYYADDEELTTTAAIIWTRNHYHSAIANAFINYFIKSLPKK